MRFQVRWLAGVGVSLGLAAAPFLAAPLGRLSSPFALLLTLPPLALALERLGWTDRLAIRFSRLRSAGLRLVAAYAAWVVTSAALTLDVAAVAAASVGLAVARNEDERRWQLGGAILGANAGSLLFPFSNLTNLVLVAASGISFAAYVGVAIWPQLAVAVVVGLLFAIRSRRVLVSGEATKEVSTTPVAATPTDGSDLLATAAAGVALTGAALAVVFGLTGGDMAVPFSIAAGLIVGSAVALDRLQLPAVARAIPVSGLAVLAVAFVVSGPLTGAAAVLPLPANGIGGLVLALAVGALLAVLANNLLAAVFGAVWLSGVHPATIVAFLIGTNVAAVATPHGSVATILARTIGRRQGVSVSVGEYLRSAWRYAAVGALSGLIALVVVAR